MLLQWLSSIGVESPQDHILRIIPIALGSGWYYFVMALNFFLRHQGMNPGPPGRVPSLDVEQVMAIDQVIFNGFVTFCIFLKEYVNKSLRIIGLCVGTN